MEKGIPPRHQIVELVRIAKQRANGVNHNKDIQSNLNFKAEKLFRDKGNANVQDGQQRHNCLTAFISHREKEKGKQAKQQAERESCPTHYQFFVNVFLVHIISSKRQCFYEGKGGIFNLFQKCIVSFFQK